jgi:NADPH2:quinone reductase
VRAAWYEYRGQAAETLVVGEMPDVEPGEGEVRIKVAVSGLSPRCACGRSRARRQRN